MINGVQHNVVARRFFYDRARLFYYLANGFQTFDLFVLYL